MVTRTIHIKDDCRLWQDFGDGLEDTECTMYIKETQHRLYCSLTSCIVGYTHVVLSQELIQYWQCFSQKPVFFGINQKYEIQTQESRSPLDRDHITATRWQEPKFWQCCCWSLPPRFDSSHCRRFEQLRHSQGSGKNRFLAHFLGWACVLVMCTLSRFSRVGFLVGWSTLMSPSLEAVT